MINYTFFQFCLSTDKYFAGPLDNWSTPLSTGKITYCFTAIDSVQSPAMESNHDTNYLSAVNMDWISEIDFTIKLLRQS